jgi:hypothetical protein
VRSPGEGRRGGTRTTTAAHPHRGRRLILLAGHACEMSLSWPIRRGCRARGLARSYRRHVPAALRAEVRALHRRDHHWIGSPAALVGLTGPVLAL